MSVLVLCLRVNGLKREWWLDLPELISIRLGEDAFQFNEYDDSSELIMRSGYDEMKWWIDLPKLTSLTAIASTKYSKSTFYNPRFITLESTSYPSSLTNRHALSHYCYSWQGGYLQIQGEHSHQEFLSLPSLIPRHHSRSPRVPLLSSFFQTPLPSHPHPFSIPQRRNTFHIHIYNKHKHYNN